MAKVFLEIESDQIEDLIERLKSDSKVKELRLFRSFSIDFADYKIEEFKNLDPLNYQKKIRKEWDDNEIFA